MLSKDKRSKNYYDLLTWVSKSILSCNNLEQEPAIDKLIQYFKLHYVNTSLMTYHTYVIRANDYAQLVKLSEKHFKDIVAYENKKTKKEN